VILTSPALQHWRALPTFLAKRLLVMKHIGLGRSRTCAERSYCLIVPANLLLDPAELECMLSIGDRPVTRATRK
jgi:hypothetical protein